MVNIKAWNVPEKFCSKIAKDVRPSKLFLMFDVFTCFTNCFFTGTQSCFCINAHQRCDFFSLEK